MNIGLLYPLFVKRFLDMEQSPDSNRNLNQGFLPFILHYWGGNCGHRVVMIVNRYGFWYYGIENPQWFMTKNEHSSF